MKTNFFSLAFLLLINIIYSQNIGDYRTIASGNWDWGYVAVNFEHYFHHKSCSRGWGQAKRTDLAQ